jgi:predicted enzyme related to lactoylglutathione lyase
MHRSRLAGFIIDCDSADLDEAADFWAAALGYPKKSPADVSESPYVELETSDDELVVEVQQVGHESRVHIDIESDDIEAEAIRLEALGATRVGKIQTWLVMEAPTGQRFCIVRAVSKRFAEIANEWQ